MPKLSVRTLAIVAGGLITLVGLVWFLIGHGLMSGFLSLNVSACYTDDEVAQAEREPYEAAALKFARTLLSGNADEVYALMSELAHKQASKDHVTSALQTLRALSGMAGALRITHSYQHKISATGQPDETMRNGCTLVAHGSPGSGEGEVQMAVLKIPLQAYVILQGDLADTRYAIYLWLMPQGDNWVVNSFYVSPAAVSGHSGPDLGKLADEQAKKGHIFNALMLYRGAVAMLAGGPNFTYGLEGVIEKAALGLNLPSDVKANPPYTWKTGEQSFQLIAAQAAGSGNGVALLLKQELPKSGDDSFIEAQNQALLKLLHVMHPEYKDAFAKVVVEAVVPGHDGAYHTIENVQ